MLQVLKVPAVEALRPAAGLGPARRLLRLALLRAAERAGELAARLEAAEALARRRAEAAVVQPWAPPGARAAQWAEVAVGVVVAAYFLAGLAGILVA